MSHSENIVPDTIDIQGFRLFADMSWSQLKWIGTLLVPHTVEAHEVVLTVEASGPGTGLYFLQEGTMRAFIGPPIQNPREPRPGTIFELYGAGGMFGEFEAIDGEFPYTVIAQEPSRFWYLSQSDCERCCEDIPAFRSNLTHIIVQSLRRITHRESIMIQMNPLNKIIWQLLNFSEDYGVPGENGPVIQMAVTPRDLADLLAIEIGESHRLLASLIHNGFISTREKGYILIQREAALREFYERGPGPHRTQSKN